MIWKSNYDCKKLGIVYAAHDEKLNRRVALKVLQRCDDPALKRRILDEARKAAALSDPAIVTIFSVLDETDREKNRHAAFGLGRHRCLGSSLARMELRVALQEWMARYPDFELSDPAAVTWSGGQVRGPRTLPVTILAS